MDKKKYPLVLSQTIRDVLNEFRSLVIENSELIEVGESKHLFYMRDIDNHEFRFFIYSPHQGSDSRPLFMAEYIPYNVQNLESTKVQTDIDGLKSHFNNWIDIIEDYNVINFEEEDDFVKQYEEEFYSEFEILDDNAETHPFNNNQQIFIYHFLTAFIDRVKKEEPNEQLLFVIQEAENLKDNIQNFTKRKVVKTMSKIFARVKKFSLKLTIDILDVAKKEIIKKGLYEGLGAAGNLLDTFF